MADRCWRLGITTAASRDSAWCSGTGRCRSVNQSVEVETVWQVRHSWDVFIRPPKISLTTEFEISSPLLV
jgi:hypothetical protein